MRIKITLFYFFILVCSGQTLLAQQKQPDLTLFEKRIVLSDQFTDNSGNWITDNQYIHGIISGGQYLIKCKNFKGTTGLSYKTVELDYSKDFEIEVVLTILKGSGGIVFGLDEKFFHYRFEINEDQDVFFVRNDTKITEYISESANNLIKKGLPNKLTVRKTGSNYFLYVNEELVGNSDSPRNMGKSAGFNVGKDSEIIVDNFSIAYLETKQPVLIGKSSSSIDYKKNEEFPVTEGDMTISWTSPSSERVSIQDYSAWARARIKSTSGIETVVFYVNGVSVGQSEFQPVAGEANTYTIGKLINLKPGENTVYFLVTDLNNKSQRSDLRFFTNPESIPTEIVWSYPLGQRSIVNTEKISIDAVIKSKTELIAARIMVNGVPFEQNAAALAPDPKGEIRLQQQVILRDGENSIYIAATNSGGTNYSEGRTIILNKSLAEKRIALVIGNSDYQNKVTLKNPINDANLMEATLKDLNFKVMKGINLSMGAMLDSIREFSRKLSDYNVALFYFAGHGIQVDGTNYLIPVDAKLNDISDCNWETVPVNKITDEFKRHNTNTNILVLDACRNNPYRSWSRGEINGFKALAPVNGTIISFATSEGSTAADGQGLNGPFTEELVKQMMIPQNIMSVFMNTRKNVKLRTKELQVPVEWNYLTEDFYFVKPK